MRASLLEPAFAVHGDDPALFTLRHRPAGPAKVRVLALAPFAEEMNKCRRMMALGARALAAGGAEVLQFDPRGTGDSAGDFDDATWSDWLGDAERMLDRFEADASTPLWLWGIRAGALQAVALAAAPAVRDASPNLLLWAPVASGRQHLQQFLRMKLAADLAADGNRVPGAMAGLRRELDHDGSVEVAGYRLSAALAHGLEAARLTPPPGRTVRIVAADVTGRFDAEPQPQPATAAFVKACLDAGHDALAFAVHGPAFWQTVEIEEAPGLLGASVAAVCTPTRRVPA